jgi:hypothetical protein
MYLCVKNFMLRFGPAMFCCLDGARPARSSYFLAASGGGIERLIRLCVFDYGTSWTMSTIYQRRLWERGRHKGRYTFALIEAGIVQDLKNSHLHTFNLPFGVRVCGVVI